LKLVSDNQIKLYYKYWIERNKNKLLAELNGKSMSQSSELVFTAFRPRNNNYHAMKKNRNKKDISKKLLSLGKDLGEIMSITSAMMQHDDSLFKQSKLRFMQLDDLVKLLDDPCYKSIWQNNFFSLNYILKSLNKNKEMRCANDDDALQSIAQPLLSSHGFELQNENNYGDPNTTDINEFNLIKYF